MRRMRFGMIIGMLAIGLLGCSTPTDTRQAPKTVPVKGKVVDKSGKPTAVTGMVSFHLKSDGTVMAKSRIGEDGSFELQTLFNDDKIPGAAVGSHEVVVRPPSGDQTQGGAISPITIGIMEVKAGDNNLTVTVPSRGKK